MKTVTTFAILLISTLVTNGQNIWIADNNFNAPTGSHIFSSIQEAVNAASDGDIVQVQPSPNTYGSVTINKEIKLVGIGFNVSKDIPLGSTMGGITLTNNADNTSDADGTSITGLTFGQLTIGVETGGDFVISNILVENCVFNEIYNESGSGYSPVDGLTVRGSWITSSIGGFACYIYKTASNITYSGNLIYSDIGFFGSTTSIEISGNILYGSIRADNSQDAIIVDHNTFVGATGGETAFRTEFVGNTVENNIFYGSTPSIETAGSTSALFQNNTFNNNLVFSTGDDTMPPNGGGAGNFGSANQAGSPNFVNSQLLNSWSSSYNFTPQSPSPALGNGTGGTDIGITGSIEDWTAGNVLMSTSKVPVVQTFNTSTVINSSDNLPIRVIINSN